MAAKVLISGGNGFLGRAIRESLAGLGVEVCLLIREGSSINLDLKKNESKRDLKWPEGLSSLELTGFDFFIFLSHAPVSESMSYEEVSNLNLRPLNLLLKIFRENQDPPHLIFISSQAAISKNKSKYGRLKSDSEIEIKESGVSATVVRPGLIIGEGHSGLFNSMNKIIRLFPIIPVIGSDSDKIQIVHIEDFIKVLLQSSGLTAGGARKGFKIIEVAEEPINFGQFLRKIAAVQGLKRLYIRVPNFLIMQGFWILENIFQYRKISSSSFLGFLNLEMLDHSKIWEELQIESLGVDRAIEKSVIAGHD